jgi:hypothetical protein
LNKNINKNNQYFFILFSWNHMRSLIELTPKNIRARPSAAMARAPSKGNVGS